MPLDKSSLSADAEALRKQVADQPLVIGGHNDNSQQKLVLHLWDSILGLDRTTTRLNKVLIWLTVALVVISIVQVALAWLTICRR